MPRTHGAFVGPTESAALSQQELQSYFETQVRPRSERERFMHVPAESTEAPLRAQNSPAFRESLALLYTDRRERTFTDLLDQSRLARSLQDTLAKFADFTLAFRIEERFRSLENGLRAVHGRLDAIHDEARMREYERIRDVIGSVEPFLGTIQEAFSEAFGGTCPLVTMLPSASDDARQVTVVLDVSAADPELVSARRAAGARRNFYESLLDGIPAPIFDLLEFEFRFPDE